MLQSNKHDTAFHNFIPNVHCAHLCAHLCVCVCVCVSMPQVKRALAKHDITTHCFNADVLYEPWQILDSNKQPYTTFKAFWQGVLTMPQPPTLPLPAPAALPLVDAALFSADVNELDWFMTPEQEASSDLLKFKVSTRGLCVVHAWLVLLCASGHVCMCVRMCVCACVCVCVPVMPLVAYCHPGASHSGSASICVCVCV